MQVNLFTLFFMIVIGVILNYMILHLLTYRIYPPGIYAGRQGMIGDKGEDGSQGRIGIKGVKNKRQNRGQQGQEGPTGGEASCTYDVKYCKNSNEWELMGLTSYNARNKTGCLFGYKYKNGVCKSPIKGNKYEKDILKKYGISQWQPANSGFDNNCDYNKNVITKLHPPQFKKWAELMSKRECPGVPVNGSVSGAEGGNIDLYTNEKYQVCSMIFKDCSNCNVNQHKEVCQNSNMDVANAGQVEYALNKCGKNFQKHGRISDGRFAFPTKTSTADYNAGPNINASNKNEGVFCIDKDAPKDIKLQSKPLESSGTCSVKFVGGASSNLQESEIKCGKGYTLATPDEVFKAWENCGLHAYAYGRMSNNKFAVPLQSNAGNWKRGPNLNYNDGGNQGQLCIKGGKKLEKWTRIPGGLKQVTASGKGWVWGVNKSNNIYKCEKPCFGDWKQVSGGLVQVSADNKEVWGVNSKGSIYKRPVDGSGPNWQLIPGGLKHVSASGNGWIWGVNNANQIYKCKKPCNGNWENIADGRLKMVSGGKTNVYGIGLSNGIWSRPIDGSGSWKKIPRGVLKEVSASNDGYIWGVNSAKNIYRCKEPCNGDWEHDSSGKLNQISSGTDYVWGIGQDGESIWKKSKNAPIPKTYQYEASLRNSNKGYAESDDPFQVQVKGSKKTINFYFRKGFQKKAQWQTAPTVSSTDIGNIQSIHIKHLSGSDGTYISNFTLKRNKSEIENITKNNLDVDENGWQRIK